MKHIFFVLLLLPYCSESNAMGEKIDWVKDVSAHNLYDMSNWYGKFDICPEYMRSPLPGEREHKREMKEKKRMEYVQKHPLVPADMVEQMMEEEEARTSLTLSFKNPLFCDMQAAIRNLDYEAAKKCLKDVVKLSEKQSEVVYALLRLKRESLVREACDLQDKKMKGADNHASFYSLPALEKICDLVRSKA